MIPKIDAAVISEIYRRFDFQLSGNVAWDEVATRCENRDAGGYFTFFQYDELPNATADAMFDAVVNVKEFGDFGVMAYFSGNLPVECEVYSLLSPVPTEEQLRDAHLTVLNVVKDICS